MIAIAAERSAIASYRVIPSLASIAASLACSAAVLERKTPAIVTQNPITVARTPNTLTTSAHLVAHSRSAFIGFVIVFWSVMRQRTALNYGNCRKLAPSVQTANQYHLSNTSDGHQRPSESEQWCSLPCWCS